MATLTDQQIAEKNAQANANNLNNTITPAQLAPTIPVKTVNTPTDNTNYAGITGGVTESILNEYTNLNNQLNKQQESQNQTGTSIIDSMNALLGKTADTQAANEQAGVNTETANLTKYAEQLAGLNAQATSLNREAQAIPIQTQQNLISQGRIASDVGIAPENAGALRLNALKALSIAQQSDIAAAAATGSQLRLQAAKDKAQQIVDLKYKPLEDALAIKKQQYELNKDVLSSIDKKRTEALNLALQKEERVYNDTKAVATEAAKNGAPLDVIDAITNAKDYKEAIKASGDYLATSQNEIVKLDNGSTVVVNKKTGQVVSRLGGGKASDVSVVARKVNGTPVSGYTLVAGDDPYFIAQQYGTTVAELKKINPNVKDWNNIQVGATLNVPQSTGDAYVQSLKATAGGKSLTDTSIQKLDKGLTVLNQLGVLQKNVEGLKTGPITGLFKSKDPWNTQAQTIKTSLNAIVPNLARGVYGEVGVLTDNDIKTYSKTIPNLTSTEEVRNAVLYITLDMIGKSIKNTLNVNAAAGRDVSGFVDIYTEMENTKNSILSGIPTAQVPQAFKQQDDFLSQFSGQTNLNNNDFFSQFK